MRENLGELIRSMLEPISHAINNKVASFTAASGLFTAGVVSETSTGISRNLNETPITEIFTFVPSIAAASMYLGGTWMIICISKELFKFVRWLYRKVRNRGL